MSGRAPSIPRWSAGWASPPDDRRGSRLEHRPTPALGNDRAGVDTATRPLLANVEERDPVHTYLLRNGDVMGPVQA